MEKAYVKAGESTYTPCREICGRGAHKMSFTLPRGFEGIYGNVIKHRNSMSNLSNNRDRLEHICWEVQNNLKHDLDPDIFTPYDTSHNIMVERALYKLIPPARLNKKANSEEIFLLLAAIWLHDVGMNPQLFKNDLHLDPKDWDGIEKWENEVRATHGERSARYIAENGDSLKLNGDEIYALKKMCIQHRYKQYTTLLKDAKYNWQSDVNLEKVRVPLLTSYLRLADALHIDQRSPEKGQKCVEAFDLDDDIKYCWLKSKYVNPLEPDANGHKLIIEIKKPDISNSNLWDLKMEPLKKMIEIDLQNELDSVRDVIIRGNFPIYLVAEVNCRPTYLNPDEILELEKLLTYTKLFKIPMSPTATNVTDDVLKEINLYLGSLFSIDAKSEEVFRTHNISSIFDLFNNHGYPIDKKFTVSGKDSNYSININGDIIYKIKRYNDKLHIYEYNDPSDIIEFLISYRNKKLKKVIENRPHHTYNRIIEEILNRSLPHDHTNLQSNERSLSKIQKAICTLHDKTSPKNSRLKKLQENVYKYIVDNNPIFVYGYSGSVLKCLEYALSKDEKLKADLRIYVGSCTTLNRHRYNNQLVYSNGIKYIKRLRDAGFENISYVPDSCSSHLFSRNLVKGVFFGVNGIDIKGNAAGPLGQLAIADNARCYHIPVFIVADSLKILKSSFDENGVILRNNDWFTTDICCEKFLEGLKNYNPREDIIPSNRIEYIITDQGVIPPEEIGNYSINWNDIMEQETPANSVDESEDKEHISSGRIRYEASMGRLLDYIQNSDSNIKRPVCFISYAWGMPEHEKWVEERLASDLQKANIEVLLDRWDNSTVGSNVAEFISQINESDSIVVVGTPLYLQKSKTYGIAAAEMNLIDQLLLGNEKQREKVRPIILDGDKDTSLPPLLRGKVFADFRQDELYYPSLFNLIVSIYNISFDSRKIMDLRV